VCPYSWARIAYEGLGLLCATGRAGHRQLEVVQIRISIPREIVAAQFAGRPAAFTRDSGAYISQRDLQQLLGKSIEAHTLDNGHGVPFQIFYGISDNARTYWGVANARRVIGYAPEGDAEVRCAADIVRYLTGDTSSGAGLLRK
jgi:hypothetical protein